MSENRKFIMANCTNNTAHCVAVDEIKHISPRDNSEKLITKIVLKTDQLLYTTDTAKELYDKILKAQRTK